MADFFDLDGAEIEAEDVDCGVGGGLHNAGDYS